MNNIHSNKISYQLLFCIFTFFKKHPNFVEDGAFNCFGMNMILLFELNQSQHKSSDHIIKPSMPLAITDQLGKKKAAGNSEYLIKSNFNILN